MKMNKMHRFAALTVSTIGTFLAAGNVVLAAADADVTAAASSTAGVLKENVIASVTSAIPLIIVSLAGQYCTCFRPRTGSAIDVKI